MIRLLTLAAVFAVTMGVVGIFTQSALGGQTSTVLAQEEPPPEECCFEEPPPEECCFEEPPPEEAPPPEECCFDEPPPEGDFSGPPPDGEFFAPPDGDFGGPPPDGEFFAPPEGECCFGEPPPGGEFFHEPPSGEFFFEPPEGGFIEGREGAGPGFDGGGTFFFDDKGDFVFEGGPGGGPFGGPGPGFGGPGPGDPFGDPFVGPEGPGYFPDGDFHDFFNPGDFEPGVFVDTFRPDEFAGDFGDFFKGEDFQPGSFDDLFQPGEFQPDDFGSFFNPEEFNPGDFGSFAAVGEDFVDFGVHFENFFGERPEEAGHAVEFFGDIRPEDFQFFAPDALLENVQNLDYQGFREMDKDVVFELFNDGLDGQQFDLQGNQWAGAFSQFDPEDIKGMDHEFLGDAVHDFAPQDFLGIPDDQAFALFEATFFAGGSGPGPGFEGEVPPPGFEGGPPPAFDPAFFAERLDEFEGQLGGFLGAMGPENFDKIDDAQLVDMMGRIDFAAPDFDRSVLGADDLGGIFGALEHDALLELGGEHVFNAIGGLETKDFGTWDPEAAFNVFDNIDFNQALEFEHIGGLIGAMDPDQFREVDDTNLIQMFNHFNFAGPDFTLAETGMEGRDVAGMIGAMEGEALGQLGVEGIRNAMQHLDDRDLGVWDGGKAFEVMSTMGLDNVLELEQLEGMVGRFEAEHIGQLGEGLDNVLGALDWETNGDLLTGFSFDALSVLDGERLGAMPVDHLVNLTNTTGGDAIVVLPPEQLETIVGNLQADAFAEFDPTVVGGMFAGMESDRIGGMNPEILEAALEAAGANLLGGLGDFDAISGGDTAFDLLADTVDSSIALEQDGSAQLQEGAVSFFSGSLFGGN